MEVHCIINVWREYAEMVLSSLLNYGPATYETICSLIFFSDMPHSHLYRSRVNRFIDFALSTGLIKNTNGLFHIADTSANVDLIELMKHFNNTIEMIKSSCNIAEMENQDPKKEEDSTAKTKKTLKKYARLVMTSLYNFGPSSFDTIGTIILSSDMQFSTCNENLVAQFLKYAVNMGYIIENDGIFSLPDLSNTTEILMMLEHMFNPGNIEANNNTSDQLNTENIEEGCNKRAAEDEGVEKDDDSKRPKI